MIDPPSVSEEAAGGWCDHEGSDGWQETWSALSVSPLITNTYSWLLIVLDETGAGCRRPSRSLRPPPSSFPGGQSAAHAEVKWRAATSWKVDVMWFTAANTFFPPALSLEVRERLCRPWPVLLSSARRMNEHNTHSEVRVSLCVSTLMCFQEV